jgi:hypothetical protein
MKDKRVNFFIDEETYQRIRHRAFEEGITQGEYLRRAELDFSLSRSCEPEVECMYAASSHLSLILPLGFSHVGVRADMRKHFTDICFLRQHGSWGVGPKG